MKEVKRIGVTEILGRKIVFYGSWEEPLFLGRDVADWINHNKPNEIVLGVNKSEKLKAVVKHSGQRRKMWFLTEDGFKQALSNSRKIKAKEILEQLDNNYILRRTPKQTNFEAMLKIALNVHLNKTDLDFEYCPFNNEKDYSLCYKYALFYEVEKYIGKYRVDFYFPKFNLIVEYDEKHHNYQKEQDKEREYYLHNYINYQLDNETWEHDGSLLTIIRVDEGEEFEGIIKIISHLMYIAFVV